MARGATTNFRPPAPLSGKNADACRLEQLFIGQWAGVARLVIQWLECNAGRRGQRGKICLLADDVGGDERAIRAGSDLGRAQLGCRDKAGWKQVADAVEFGAGGKRAALWRWAVAIPNCGI